MKSHPRRAEPRLKRPLDVALALTMLIPFAPAWGIVAIAIKHDDGGPVFYHQERWGRDGRTFSAMKFRTMATDSDQRFGIRQATEDDERITRVGRFLRASGLDEIPQLINICRGEMSFVGPRALSTSERDTDGNALNYKNSPRFAERMAVRPGLTSIATIYLPKDATVRRKFAADVLYARRQSFLLDVRLILLSFWISFHGKWESRGGKV